MMIRRTTEVADGVRTARAVLAGLVFVALVLAAEPAAMFAIRAPWAGPVLLAGVCAGLVGVAVWLWTREVAS